MFKVVGKQTPATGKLVLGFDAGCGTCSDLAGRVQERVGDKLSVENLNDLQLIAWREEALGKDAKWAPTLFEVDGDKVIHAWTGWKMGWALSRKLGPATTWQVMQALGEVGAAPRIEDSPIVEKLPERAVEAVAGVSRGQFLKGLGGAAVAMSVLSGTDLLAAPANAATRTSPYDIVRIVHLTGSKAAQVVQRAKLNADTRVVLRGNLGILGNKHAAYKQTLRNGTIVHATVFFLSGGTILTSCILGRSIGNRATSVSKLWRPVAPGSKRMMVVRASEGGTPWRVLSSSNSTLSSSNQVVPLGDCPPVGGGSGGGSNGHWCTITTNQCISRGESLTNGNCSLPTLVSTGTCIGAIATAAAATVGSAGIAGLGAFIFADATCALATRSAMNCCLEYKKVQVWCRG